MNKFHFKYLLIAALLATTALIGCGGGGGGGGGGGVDPTAGSLVIPASAQFAVPSTYTSEPGAFPTVGPNVELTLNNFTNTSEALMVFANMSNSQQQLTWNVDKLSTAASRRDSVVLKKNIVDNSGPVSQEHSFHLMLRQQAQRQQRFGQAAPSSLRASTRAVAVNDEQSFTVYVSNDQTETITAVCKNTELLAGTDKRFHIFVEKSSASKPYIDYVAGKLAENWQNIYLKNRQIFGEEPTGVLDNGVNATDFYIVISPKVFTAGYFFTGDLNLTSVTPTSNQKKIFFLQLENITTDDERDRSINTLSATMAHEFQHMIHFWQRGSNSDIWLEEAMSGYAEYINGYRIENKNNQSKALQVNFYFERVSEIQLDVWHSSTDSDAVVNSHYGKVFLFGVWLAQNYGASGSVVSLLKSKTSDVAAIEAFTGKNFGELYSKFMLALIINNPAADNDGYGIDELDLKSLRTFDYGLKDVQLTGPHVDSVGATVESLARPTIAPRAAVYVKVVDGDGSSVWLASTLPAGTALYQLRKD
ncbi:MAG: hypothetical protein CVV42_14390 [Candidatus Riflebacteria bacterium HGW-Riflebacteria-2]|jgi:hypothetical protein|nr:MAG: hypothetical protein CVV42_14390 [Candidatus Riflebacteria bacterium HGW-Riflebacteria-2]